MKANSFITKETALLESMMAGTDKDTRRYLKNMHESFVVPYTAYLNKLSRRIDEAQLTQDQISQLFGAIAGPQGAVGGTVLPDSVKQKFDAALPPADAGPVQGFEQKAAQAAAQVQDPQAKQGIMNLIKQGLQNPVAQKMILTGISGLAGVAASALTGGLGGALGAGAAGALTGGLMGVITAKMQGADWKTAGMAGLKGAGMGGLAGAIGGTAASMGQQALGAMTSGGQDTSAAAPSGEAGESDFKLPVDSQIANRNVANANADAWRAADDAGKQDIEQATGMTADQLKNQNTGSGAGTSDFAKTDPRRLDQQPAAAKFTSQDSDAEDFSGTATPQQQQDADAAITQQAQAAGATGSTSSEKFTGAGAKDQAYGKVRANLDQWRTDTGSPNAPQAANLGPDFDPSKIPDGWTMKTGATPVAGPSDQVAGLDTATDTSGPTAGGVPVGSTPPGINRLTGKPISSGPSWDEMTPDQQAATQAKQQQQRQDAEQGTQNARDYWKNKPSYTRSLKNSKQPTRPMLEAVDRDLTIRMWALNESLGKKRGGVQITEAGIKDVIGKITNFFKGGGASKGKSVEDLQTAWQRAGSPMDSEQLAEFLKKQGIADDIIANAYKQVGIPAPGEKVEPKMAAEPAAQPEAPAAQAEPAQAAAQPKAPAAQAEPAAPAAEPAAQAQAAATQPTSTGTVFDNPEQLAKDFEEYMSAGGKISPQFRGAIKAALQTGFKVVESKQRKLLKVLKEARRIDRELKKIKKQRL